MTNLFNELYACKDTQVINNAITIIANVIDKRMTADEKTALSAQLRKALLGNHFDHERATQRISRMYYATPNGNLVHAPFVTEKECADLYEQCKEKIGGYNLYDFAVVLNDTIANFHNLLHDWWCNEDEDILMIKYCEIAVNWLNDDDTPYKGEKAWCILGK